MSFPTGGTPTTAPLPTGAATAARQDTGNASLSSSIAGVSDQVWLCASRLTGTTEDFYASMVTGEVP